MKKYALCLLLVIPFFAHAQSFTPVEYNFPTNPSQNTSGYTAEGGSTVNPNFASMAANGYGTWATDGIGNWFLLGDTLQNESVENGSHPAIPSGIIQQGSLMGDIQAGNVKVCANLNGQVRFVGPAYLTQSFTIQGFNDDRTSSLPGNERHISIKFDSIPKKTMSTKVVKYAPTVYPPALNETVIGGIPVYHPVWSGELDWRDAFDVACDQKYVYIVWESRPVTDVGSVVHNEIWAMALYIESGKVDTTSGTAWPLRFTQTGRRPTVSCNVRANPAKPDFDVAYIEYIPPGGPGNGVRYLHFRNNVFVGKWLDHKCVFHLDTITNWDEAMHARVVTSSTTGSQYPVKAVYVITDNTGNMSVSESDESNKIIVEFIRSVPDETLPGTRARMIDGNDMNYGGRPAPLLTVDRDSAHIVLNRHIIAFANPYDADTNATEYDEFHCLYMLRRKFPIGGVTRDPFCMIARGFSNGVVNDFTSTLTPDTRTIINQRDTGTGWIFMDEPNIITSAIHYMGSVNQQGIHLYWTDKNGKYNYSRDTRVIDEPIEENTLLTHTNYIGDGRYHFGTIGAKLLPGRELTLWTDPNFDVHNTTGEQAYGVYTAHSGSLYQRGWNNCKLFFLDSGSTLTIGDSVEARLTMLPNFEVYFQADSLNGLNQKIAIKPNSVWHYYGIPTTSIGTQVAGAYNFYGGGSLVLEGQSSTLTDPSFGYPTALTKPASIIIHGGAELKLSDYVNFTASNSIVEYKNQNSIEPPYPSSTPDTNLWKSGRSNHSGEVMLTNSIIMGNSKTFVDSADIMTIKPWTSITGDSNVQQFHSLRTLFTNSGNNGVSRLVFASRTNAANTPNDIFRQVDIDGGKFLRTQVYALNPDKHFSVNTVTFDSMQFTGVHLVRKDTLDYSNIVLTNNIFKRYKKANSNGILVEGFDLPDTTTLYRDDFGTYKENRIEVSNNLFTESTTGIANQTAIQLLNTSAGIAGNTISSGGYNYGIVNRSINPFPPTFSFLCSNNISNCTKSDGSGAGIKTDNWNNYIKLTNINDCDNGHISGDNDFARLSFSNISDCFGPGILVTTAPSVQSKYRMMGYGHNTLSKNNNASGYPRGQFEINDYTDLIIGHSINTSVSRNNFIRNDTNDNFIYKAVSGSLNIGNINWNYWENGNGSAYHYFPSDGNAPFQNISYTYSADTVESTFSGVYCGSGFSFLAGKESKVQWLDSVSCQSRFDQIEELYNQGKYQATYDSIRAYIENCALEKKSFFVFTDLNAANQLRNNGHGRFAECREWLKKVLYYNPDTNYYCADVGSIIRTFAWFDDTRGVDIKGQWALFKFLLETGKCGNDSAYWIEKINTSRDVAFQRYKDTVTDETLTPFDSTLPTLEDLDLEILRGQSSVHSSPKQAEENILNASASVNPFTNETMLLYTLRKNTMIHIEIFDVLGRTIYSMGEGRQTEGQHQIQINGKDWSSGVYYARITTSGGETRTLKLQKQ